MEPLKILYIEDEESQRAAFAEQLRGKGLTVYPASGGPEGIKVFTDHAVDIVLCDLNMPEMDGLEVLNQVRKRKPETPFIILTHRGTIKQAVRAIKQGANDFILKPPEINEIETSIQNALEKSHLQKELDQSEDNLRMLMENLPDIVYSLDAKGRFLRLNPASEILLGYKPSELLGRSFFDILYDEDLERVRHGFDYAMQSGDTVLKTLEFRMISKTGEIRHFEIRRRLILKDNKVVRQDGIARDVTKRKQLEKELKAYSEELEKRVTERTERVEYANRQLAALNAVSNRFSLIYDEGKLLDEVPAWLTDSLDFDRAFVVLHQDGKFKLQSFCLKKDSPEFTDKFLDRVRGSNFQLPPHFRESLEENKTIFIPDLNADPRWPREPGQKVIRTKAMVITPIKVNKEPIGILIGNMQHHDREMNDQDVARFEMFANIVGLALDNVRAYQSLEKKVIERTRSLREANKALRGKARQLEKSTYSLGRANVELLSMQEELKKKNAEMQKLLKELSKSKDELQAILDSSLSVVFMVDNVGKIITVNRQIDDYFGLKVEEVLAQSITNVIRRIKSCFEDAQKFQKVANHLRKNPDPLDEDIFDLENIYQRSFELLKPKHRFVSLFSIPVLNKSGEEIGQVWTFTDITKIKQADEQLRAIVQASPLPLIVSRVADGKIFYVNEPLGKLLGYNTKDLIGRFTPDFYYNPADRKLVVEKVRKDNFLRNHEIRIKKSDGTAIWVILSIERTEVSGEPMIIAALYDINERKKAEERLRDSEAKNRALLNAIPDLMFQISQDGIILDYKDSGNLGLDTAPENFLGQRVDDIFSSDIAAKTRANIALALETGDIQFFEYQLPLNGSMRDYEARMVVSGEDKVLVIVRDITERKQAEEDLKRERNFVSAVLDTAGALVVVLDPAGQIVRFNRECEQVTGYAFNEVRGKYFWDLFLIPSEVDRVRALFDRIVQGDFPSYGENYWLTKAGGHRLIAWSNTALVDKEKRVEYIIATGIDITERKQAEEKLKLYKQIFINSKDAINIFDPQGKFIEQNAAHRKLNGYSDEEIRGKTPALFVGEKTFARIRESLSGTGSFRGELISYPKTGDPINVELSAFSIADDDGDVSYRVGFARDITERKHAELEIATRLRYEEGLAACSQALLTRRRTDEALSAALRQLLKAADVGRVYIFENFMDEKDGLCMRQLHEACAEKVHPEIDNPVLQHVPYEPDFTRWREGFEKGDFIGGMVKDFPEVERAMLEPQGILSILALPIWVETELYGFIGFDDVREEREWNEEDVRALRTASQMIGGFIEKKKFADDLARAYHDLERTNLNLKDTQAQLVQSEKMASLGMLVAGIAHEINTPIGAIHSMHDTLMRAMEKLKVKMGDLLPREHLQDRDLRATLNVIENANKVIDNGSRRVANIVRSMRSFARLDEAELKKVDIHEGLEDSLNLIHHDIKNRIEVHRNYGDLPAIVCFPSRLNQVFLNILVNAKQAIKDKGEITLTTYHKNKKVFIEITDSGAGIPAKNLKKIFDPGFTTKGVGVGTGLGLSICYQIIQEHKGEITVSSREGQGTTFKITLPMNLDELQNGK